MNQSHRGVKLIGQHGGLNKVLSRFTMIRLFFEQEVGHL